MPEGGLERTSGRVGAPQIQERQKGVTRQSAGKEGGYVIFLSLVYFQMCSQIIKLNSKEEANV